MSIAQYTICISPHQVPLAEAVVNLVGPEAYRYVYKIPLTERRKKLGWGEASKSWMIAEYEDFTAARKVLCDADILISGERDLELFERRLSARLYTVYSAERWFKPLLGMWRLLSPSYFRMAWRFVKMLRQNEKMFCYPMGAHAAADMARLCGLFSGDLRCIFRAPAIAFERRPGGKIWLRGGLAENDCRYCLHKMRMWGYVVAPSSGERRARSQSGKLRLLWVGRFLKWKRVDTIIRAVVENKQNHSVEVTRLEIVVDIYGSGPEEARLKMLAVGNEDVIHFHPPVPNDEVRQLMREYDVYVLSSNAYEGWGAVVSEALAEGMKVVGTYEAGSSATILPESNLFHAGDWRGLLNVLRRGQAFVDADTWSAASFAKMLVMGPKG